MESVETMPQVKGEKQKMLCVVLLEANDAIQVRVIPQI